MATSHLSNGQACALSIAGLDPSGGAGLLADMRAFDAAGVWGCAVCAVLTVQSTAGLQAVHPVAAELVAEQVREVLMHQTIRAIKTGALGSAENVRVVLGLRHAYPEFPWIVDPVMVATRSPTGAKLLDAAALEALWELSRHATLVTPNIDEAEALLGERIATEAEAQAAAVALVERGMRAVLLKGGHLDGPDAVDVLVQRRPASEQGKFSIDIFRAPRDTVAPFHGGGCTLAALIAGRLARRGTAEESCDDTSLGDAVRWAKTALTQAITRASSIGDGLLVLDPVSRDHPPYP